jgi:hypothetical protein
MAKKGLQETARDIVLLLTGRSILDDGTKYDPSLGGGVGVGTVVLSTFRATANGTGYSTGDIIILRQTAPASPEYYNATTNAVITPLPADLGPVGSSSSVSVTSLPALATGSNAIGSITNTAFGISGTLPSFAATPTFNLGTAPAIVLAAGSSTIGAISNTTFASTQSGTWNLNNISGAISLPTGAATSALQTQLSGQLPTSLGTKTAANSISVTPASDASHNVAARTPTTANVSSSASSVAILASNANRKGVSFYNNSSATLYLSFSGTATIANAFVAIPSQGFLLLDQQLITSGAINGIWSAANGSVNVTEFV